MIRSAAQVKADQADQASQKFESIRSKFSYRFQQIDKLLNDAHFNQRSVTHPVPIALVRELPDFINAITCQGYRVDLGRENQRTKQIDLIISW